MQSNSSKQIYLINKIKNYLNKIFSRYNLISSGLIYFSPFGQNISFGLMSFWINKKKFFFLKLLFKEIYALINFAEYRILSSSNNKSKYKNIIITWGGKNNFDKKGIFYDNYFNTNSSLLNDTLWFIIFSDEKINHNLNDNIVLYVKKKNKKNYILNFFFLFKILILNFYSFNKVLNLLNWQYLYAINLLENFKKISIKKLELTLLPYEGQPFQTFLIDYIRKNTGSKIHGFVHSYPSLPTHLIKRKISPNKLIVSCKDQKYSLIKYFDWNENEIDFKDSSRFMKHHDRPMKNKIFLPINFNSVEKISYLFDKLLKYLENINLSEFEIKNHPHSSKSKKHLLLIDKIKEKISKSLKKNYNTKLEDLSIFIGSTGSIVEALDQKIKVYHICEDMLFESYDNVIWPSINPIYVNKNIIKYEKKNDENLINLGNENTIFSYFKI